MSYFCSKYFFLRFSHGFLSDAVSPLTMTKRSTPAFTMVLNVELIDIKTNAFAKLSICASAHLNRAQRCNFFSSILSFGLITWVKLSKGHLVRCQCGRLLSVHFFHTHPDVLLLVMPVLGFQPAILLSVRKNFPEIPGLQELFNFFKITLFLNVNHRMSLFIIF